MRICLMRLSYDQGAEAFQGGMDMVGKGTMRMFGRVDGGCMEVMASYHKEATCGFLWVS